MGPARGPIGRFLSGLLALTAAAWSVQTQAQNQTLDMERPHILLVVADDLGWRDVGYHGSEMATPTIDRLAREGIELDRFYVQPSCSPTRAALMTGKSPLRLGVTRGFEHFYGHVSGGVGYWDHNHGGGEDREPWADVARKRAAGEL